MHDLSSNFRVYLNILYVRLEWQNKIDQIGLQLNWNNQFLKCSHEFLLK